jgi:hypothetical protein
MCESMRRKADRGICMSGGAGWYRMAEQTEEEAKGVGGAEES